jgi:hypothetical protein
MQGPLGKIQSGSPLSPFHQIAVHLFFNPMTTFLLTMRPNSGITMTYADLGNVPLFGLCSLGLCMVGVHQGRPESHAVILIN